MGIISSIIPIVIISIIIAIIVSIVSRGAFSHNNIFFKRRNAILMSYIGLLLTLTIVFLITIQISGANQDYELNEKEVKPAFDQAHKNKDLSSNAVKVIKEWTFDFDLDKVIVHDQLTQYEIDVSYSERNDIKVTQYMMDFDHPVIKLIPPAEVWLENMDGRLSIVEPTQHVSIKAIYNELPVRQMKEDSMMESDHLIDRDSMKQYFLIEVPKGVEVELEY
ncbi:hypothetical protein ACTWQB_08850 [Piscibacillus sp. B03]|uniref:hypothetical protein n=1 Tax=Piscibacillus sp. B03 TaxID=3457430 RepID=UPI003FCD02F4